MKVKLAKPPKQDRIPSLNLYELKDDKAAHFEVANKFSVLEGLKEVKTPEIFGGIPKKSYWRWQEKQ